jgi:hypothetical protein
MLNPGSLRATCYSGPFFTTCYAKVNSKKTTPAEAWRGLPKFFNLSSRP